MTFSGDGESSKAAESEGAVPKESALIAEGEADVKHAKEASVAAGGISADSKGEPPGTK